MHPVLEYSCVALGLGLGYTRGGTLGSLVLLSSILAGLHLYMQGGRCRSTRSLKGKVVVITGANTGIGKITAADLARRGAKVIMLCRDLTRAEPAAADIRNETKGDVSVEKMDLASLASIRAAVEKLQKTVTKIDILINNAGVMMCPLSRTEDGFEMQIGTNHFGHFYLTNLLLPLVKKAAPGARIVTVSSLAHRRGRMQWEDINYQQTEYSAQAAYGQSKLANILFTRELANRLKGTGINVYSLHPGVIATELGRHIEKQLGIFGNLLVVIYPFIKTPEAGAQTSIFCAVDESLERETGLYYSDCAVKTPEPQALSDEDAKRLWELSEELTGLKK